MIQVVLSNGDRAEAETPAGAVLAARTLLDDADAYGRRKLTAMFLVDGMLVRASVTRLELSHE